MAVQQRIVFVKFTRGSTAAGEQHIIRIDSGTRGTVLNLLIFIHTFTGEERGIRFASKRVGKFFRDALATRQGTAQNTGTTRFTTLYRGLVFLFVLFFIVVIIDPRIVAAGPVAGERQDRENKAADFFGNAHP